MADEPRHASVFDALLRDGRRELDALFDAGNERRAAGAAPAADAPRPMPPAARGAVARERAARPWAASAVADELDQRFGDGWRFEVRERRRSGDEVVVLGRLSVPATGLVRAQFGAARIGAGAASGASQGVAFRIGAADTDDEAAAEARAAMAALENCARLL